MLNIMGIFIKMVGEWDIYIYMCGYNGNIMGDRNLPNLRVKWGENNGCNYGILTLCWDTGPEKNVMAMVTVSYRNCTPKVFIICFVARHVEE
jgi:hypothetical protein